MSSGPEEIYTRRQKGAAGEKAALQYLSARGYRIVDCNWRCRSGELDIIAEYGEVLIFVEVRSRSGSPLQGTPEESVDGRKIRQVRATAQVYMHMKGQHERRVSFDVISVMLNEDMTIASLAHIQEAF
ncbi:YraN family protein [Paenibacillus sp. S150]|uniref:YraN family protein n=1 Tax=Paenibacillus sp. S150 TaxID=2749826 RepID=UPI001C56BA1F|nr:YraN family protein [Paenibacillus sp. S150]MBW4083225.1 YraN family protein [Paenibacillus sp. S150]